MAKQEDYTRTQLRIPADLYNALREATDKSGRSMNAEMIARLEGSFADQDKIDRLMDYAERTLKQVEAMKSKPIKGDQ